MPIQSEVVIFITFITFITLVFEDPDPDSSLSALKSRARNGLVHPNCDT